MKLNSAKHAFYLTSSIMGFWSFDNCPFGKFFRWAHSLSNKETYKDNNLHCILQHQCTLLRVYIHERCFIDPKQKATKNYSYEIEPSR